MKAGSALVPVTEIQNMIFIVRGHKVMVDSDLAGLYGVTTSRLNEQVKRNADRFPEDFMFRLTQDESENLKSQFATSRSGWGGRRKLPYVFTEHGAIMLASVLNSTQAIEASIFVVRAFVRLREILATHKELSRKLADLERKVTGHDEDIRQIVQAIRQLMAPVQPAKRQIGFRNGENGKR